MNSLSQLKPNPNMCKALPRTFDESLSQYNMHDTKHFVSSLETIRVQGSNLRGGMDFQNRLGAPLNFEFYCIFMLQFQNFSQF